MQEFYIKAQTLTELDTITFLLERRDRLREEVKNQMVSSFNHRANTIALADGTRRSSNVYHLVMADDGYYTASQTINYGNKMLYTFNQFFKQLNN